MVKVFTPVSVAKGSQNTIFAQEKEYYKNLVEFAAVNYTQIIKSASGTGIFYTVPNGQMLFITSAYMSTVDESGVGGSNSYISIQDPSGTVTPILEIDAGTVPTGIFNTSLSYPMPLKVYSGQTIVFVSGLTRGRCGFQGFQVPFLP